MPSRKPMRLPYYDYSQGGYYFVTICTCNKVLMLGDVENGNMALNKLGQVAHKTWLDLPNHYANIDLDEFIVMPNHVHGIIIIKGNDKESDAPKDQYLSELVGEFKTWSARKINFLLHRTSTPFCQRSFYDHVIRDEQGLNCIRAYILNNPSQWGVGEDDY